jgi:hypothetical protein
VAGGEAADHRTALGSREEKLRKQLEKGERAASSLAPVGSESPLMLRLREFLARRNDPLQLEAADRRGRARSSAPRRGGGGPGLALAGYTGRFAPNRLHVFGETEITYLNRPPGRAAAAVAEKFFEFELPVHLRDQGQEVPAEMLELAPRRGRAGHAEQAQDWRSSIAG